MKILLLLFYLSSLLKQHVVSTQDNRRLYSSNLSSLLKQSVVVTQVTCRRYSSNLSSLLTQTVVSAHANRIWRMRLGAKSALMPRQPRWC